MDTPLLPDTTNGNAGALPMRCSPAIDALTVALSKAQGQFPEIVKDKNATIQTKSGASYSYAYADLATILAAIRKPLSENALAILQPVHVNGRSVTVTTIVSHASGQWISDALDLPIGDSNDARSLASAITYARRYALTAMLGIAPEEDTDGAATTSRTPRPSAISKTPAPAVLHTDRSVTPREPDAPPAAEMISDAQRKRLFAIGREHGWSPAAIKVWLAGRDITSTNEIPRARYDALIDELVLERPGRERLPGEEG